MQVRIYRPAKTAMQSGRANTRQWLVDFEPTAPKQVDPLMGWVGSRDTLSQIRLKFATRAEAIGWASRKGYDYRVYDAAERPVMKPKNYADNFRFDKVL